MNDKRIDEIRERLEKATPGPWTFAVWVANGNKNHRRLLLKHPNRQYRNGMVFDTRMTGCLYEKPTVKDAEWMHHAHADIKYLLEEVTRLSELLSGQWISCSERLPEPYKTVLCRGGSYDAGAQDGYLLAAYYPSETDELAKGDWYYGKQMNEAYDVTHWMPLPEPPLANKADSARGGE